MSASISWEVWLECQLLDLDLEYEAPFEFAEPAFSASTASSEKVAFVDSPVTISSIDADSDQHKPAKGSRTDWFAFWRRSSRAGARQLSGKGEPQPILRNRTNINRSTELELVKESDSESYDAFYARHVQEFPDEAKMYHARRAQVGNYYASK